MRNETPLFTPAPDRAGPAVRAPTLRERTQAVVVLPTLNEELGLERTLSELPFDRFGDPTYPVETVIIDGGSTDHTLDVARRWNIPVLRQTTKGKGAAVVEVLHWVRAQGVPHVAILDADATYPAHSVAPALNLLREGADLVVGVRRPVGGPPRSLRDLVHRLGNIALSYTASALSRQTIFDICSGFWAVSTEQFEALNIGATQFAIEAELVLKALDANLKVAQIPIDYRERLGQAKIHAVRDGAAILISIIQFGRGVRRATPYPQVPGVPSRQLLSIGLIAESRSAVLEYRLDDFQLANRLGLLLHRGLPEATIRLRPIDSPGTVPAIEPDPSEGSYLLVTLPAPGGLPGAPAFSVLIRPHERELTIRLPSGSPSTPVPVLSASKKRRLAFRRPGAEYLSGLGAITTRVGFDPDQLQRTILRANGFDALTINSAVAATLGGRP
jgi:Glycosyl transferase family 2